MSNELQNVDVGSKSYNEPVGRQSMSHSDCQILFEAGKALVEKSGLANYYGQDFVAGDDEASFNKYWKANFHQEFGRYMSWVLFLVGAENLPKAACVCNQVLPVKSMPTLGHYVNSHFKCLCKKREFRGGDNEDRLIKGYKHLMKVRNRDAHSYRKGVRSADFPFVKHTFVPAFNVLVVAMRDHGHPLL